MDIYLHHIDFPISDTYIETLKNQASPKRAERAMRYFRREDQVHCLVAEHALRSALKARNMSDAYQNITVTPQGKPIFGADTKGHFNLSHSGEWVACALDDKPIGIDVERRRKKLDLKVIKMFSGAEQAYINKADSTEKLSRFYRLWTLKESYLKAIGTGLRQPLDSFTIHVLNHHHAQLVINDKVQVSWYLYYFDLDVNHFGAVCAQQPINCSDFKVILNTG